jgi:hypothetical protein
MNPKTIAGYSVKGVATLAAVDHGLPALIIVAIALVTVRLIDALQPYLPALLAELLASRDERRVRKAETLLTEKERAELDWRAQRRRADVAALSAQPAEAAPEHHEVGGAKSKRR